MVIFFYLSEDTNLGVYGLEASVPWHMHQLAVGGPKALSTSPFLFSPKEFSLLDLFQVFGLFHSSPLENGCIMLSETGPNYK